MHISKLGKLCTADLQLQSFCDIGRHNNILTHLSVDGQAVFMNILFTIAM